MAVFKTEKTKDGRQWIFRTYYKDVFGKNISYKSKKYLTQKEAKEGEAKFTLNHNDLLSKNSLKFSECYLSYFNFIKNNIRESSYYGMKQKLDKNLLPYFKNHLIEKITIIEIVNWQSNLSKSLDKIYVNQLTMYFKAIFNYSRDYLNVKVLNTNLIKKLSLEIAPKEEMLFWTYDEYTNFDKVIKDDDIIYKTMFSLFYYTGLRKGELQALTWADYKDNKISVNKSLTYATSDSTFKITQPKTENSYRNIDLPNMVISRLNKLKLYYKNFDGYNNNWYIFGGIRPIPRNNIDRYLLKYCNIAKVKKIRIHDFRHSHVSYLISLGVRDYYIASRIGDTVSTVQKTYAHLFPKDIESVVNLLNKNERS